METISCELLKEKILLGEELSQQENEHIAQCEECRALFLQTEKMLGDLSKMSVPGIKDGIIADNVMKEIRKTRGAYFPKVRFSNSIATAAALVIVVALFAFNRFANTDIVFNSSKQDGLFADNTSMQKEQVLNDQTDCMSEDAVATEPVQEKFMSSGAKIDKDKEANFNTALTSSREVTQEEKEFEETNAVEKADDAVFNGRNDIVYDGYEAVEEAKPELRAVGGGSSGGAGGASTSSSGTLKKISDMEAQFEESIAVESTDEFKIVSIFDEGIFSLENTLEENVNTANRFVNMLYDSANELKVQTLKDVGVDNEMFIAWLGTVANVGEYSFDSLYSFIKSRN